MLLSNLSSDRCERFSPGCDWLFPSDLASHIVSPFTDNLHKDLFCDSVIIQHTDVKENQKQKKSGSGDVYDTGH